MKGRSDLTESEEKGNKVLKIVLDTNVLVSGIVFGGNPRKIFQKVISGDLSLAISEPILVELQAVLSGKKFQYHSHIIRAILNELHRLCEIVNPKVRLTIVKSDPDDNKILECAIESRADYIISGDKHLLELKSYRSIPILNPIQFLQIKP